MTSIKQFINDREEYDVWLERERKRLERAKTRSMKLKKPLRRLSKKRAVDYKLYLGERNEFLQGNSYCEFPNGERGTFCMNVATEVHHAKGRTGRLLRNKKWWYALCSEHHRWLHDHAKEARKLGLIKWK